jgi:DNA adenine methylase
MKRVKTFLKWAGGKGQLIEAIRESLPLDFAEKKGICYVEPFVGGGAVLFWMLENFANIKKVVVNDINSDLINVYKVVKQDSKNLVLLLNRLQVEYFALKNQDDRKKYYLEKRSEFNLRKSNEHVCASLLIFLNRTCYNGLYRVNGNNEFNVPFGRHKNPGICDNGSIHACSALLQRVTLLNADFSATQKYAGKNSFYYFDPPYKPVSKTSSFTSYAAGNFDDDEQERLAGFCRKIHKMNARWLLSNSDLKNMMSGNNYFETLYHGFHIKPVKAKRNINSVSSKRGKISELLISNYEMQEVVKDGTKQSYNS